MNRLIKAFFSLFLISYCLSYSTESQAGTPPGLKNEDLGSGELLALSTPTASPSELPTETSASDPTPLPPLTDVWVGKPRESVVKYPTDWQRQLRFGTDAVGWALLQVNLEPEIDFYPHWSFGVPIYYSAWNYFRSDIKFRTFALMPEFRYWLKPDFEGVYFGAHFGMAYYNYAFGKEWRYQDHDRRSPALGGGISVGYRMALDSQKRWNVTFSAGAGAYRLKYDKFRNEENGKRYDIISRTYWGVDHVSVTFSWSFGLCRKGGDK